MKKKAYKKRKGGKLFPPAHQSERIYVRVPREKIALFRFLLEASDNLAVFTVADRFGCVLMLRYSPHQQAELNYFLREIDYLVPVERVYPAV